MGPQSMFCFVPVLCCLYCLSFCATGWAMQDKCHLNCASDTFNTLVSPEATVTLDSIVSSPVHQRILFSCLDLQSFRSLLNASSLANKAHLLSVSAPHASSWLTVVPTVELHANLDPSEFCVAIWWWQWSYT